VGTKNNTEKTTWKCMQILEKQNSTACPVYHVSEHSSFIAWEVSICREIP